MSCSNVHKITAITASDTDVNITVLNSTDIGNLEPFAIRTCGCVNYTPPTSPLPVTITVNGTNVPLLNKYSIQILSNHIPAYAYGAYVVPEAGDPYVILFSTPRCRCNA